MDDEQLRRLIPFDPDDDEAWDALLEGPEGTQLGNRFRELLARLDEEDPALAILLGLHERFAESWRSERMNLARLRAGYNLGMVGHEHTKGKGQKAKLQAFKQGLQESLEMHDQTDEEKAREEEQRAVLLARQWRELLQPPSRCPPCFHENLPFQGRQRFRLLHDPVARRALPPVPGDKCVDCGHIAELADPQVQGSSLSARRLLRGDAVKLARQLHGGEVDRNQVGVLWVDAPVEPKQAAELLAAWHRRMGGDTMLRHLRDVRVALKKFMQRQIQQAAEGLSPSPPIEETRALVEGLTTVPHEGPRDPSRRSIEG